MANKANRAYRISNANPVGGDPPFDQYVSYNGDSYRLLEYPVGHITSVNQFYPGDDPIGRLADALDGDYTTGGAIYSLPIIITKVSSSKINITATAYGFVFDLFTAPPWLEIIQDIPEVLPTPTLSIDSIAAQAADVEDRNEYARFNISVLNGTAPYGITSPVIKSAPLASDLFFDFKRRPIEPIPNITINDTLDTVSTAFLTVEQITGLAVDVTDGIGSSTVNLIATKVIGDISIVLEYSINNLDWFSSPNFNGVLAGSYTAYVRDNLGALLSTAFTVETVTEERPAPYFDIPKNNAFRFIEAVTYDCNTIPNWDNTLFADLLNTQFPNVEKRYYAQLIADCDNVPTQLHSTYENVIIKAIDCDGGEVLLTADLKKTYINLEDSREAAFKSISSSDPDLDGRIFLYFPFNNPNKSIPLSAKNGSLFTISGTTELNGVYNPITEYYDVDTDYWGIALGGIYIGGDATTGVVDIKYNEKDYNVFEFNTLGTALATGKIYSINVLATDSSPDYPDVEWNSEPIKKIDSTYGTVAFSYSNDSNTAGIDFSTGINYRLRLEGRFIDGQTSDDIVDFTSESGKKTILKNTVTTNIVFESMPIPFYLVRKLSIVSGMKLFYINGIKYVIGEDNEAESLLSQNNPFITVTRSYQDDTSIVISDQVGLLTETRQVIGSSSVIAIGDNN